METQTTAKEYNTGWTSRQVSLQNVVSSPSAPEEPAMLISDVANGLSDTPRKGPVGHRGLSDGGGDAADPGLDLRSCISSKLRVTPQVCGPHLGRRLHPAEPGFRYRISQMWEV